jgi:serine/threonine protein kinase/WD40 repeat protein
MIGETVAHYRITAKLGEGGMGEVYLAQDTSLRRMVALKFLPVRLEHDEAAQKRFFREARSAAAIDHPFIGKIHEISEAEGRAFIVMEYIEGETLKERLAKRPLALHEALKIASEGVEALDRAHQAGIVHRDLKPSNLMLTSDGHVKVMDFGLAKRLSGTDEETTASLTRRSVTPGTLPYMSPEQLRGQPVDTRSDIFSFGVVIHEMLTGVHPFRRDTQAATVNAILSEPPAALAVSLEDTSGILQHTVEKMLAKDPSERYQSIHEVRTNIDRLSKEVSLLGEKLRAGGSRHGLWWKFVAVLSAVALFVLGWQLIFRTSNTSNVPLVALPLTSSVGYETLPNISPDGKRVAFVDDWYGDIYVMQIGTKEGKPLPLTSVGEATNPVWSPDGELVAFLRHENQSKLSVHTMPGLGGMERERAKITNVLSGRPVAPLLAWGPDGKSLIVADYPESDQSRGLFLLSLESGEVGRLTSTPEDYRDFAPAVSKDGETLAFIRSTGDYHGDIYTLRLDEEMIPIGEPVRLTHTDEEMRAFTWTSDDKAIIHSSGLWPTFRLWRTSATGDGRTEALNFAGLAASFPTASREGNRLVYQQFVTDWNIYKIELDESGYPLGPAEMFQSSSRLDSAGDYSPNGDKVVFVSNRYGTQELFVCDRDGSNVVPLTSLEGTWVGEPKWSPDGKWIVFCARPRGHGDIYRVSVEDGRPQPLTSDPSDDISPEWSADGDWIYFSSNRGGKRAVWKIPAAGGKAIETVGWEVGTSTDGEWVYYGGSRRGVWKESEKGGIRISVPQLVGFRYKPVKGKVYSWFRGSIHVYDLDTGESREVIKLDENKEFGWALTVSPDGRTILYTQDDQPGSDLMLVENFR